MSKNCFAYKTCSHCDGREYMGEANHRGKSCLCCGKRTAVVSAVVMDYERQKKDMIEYGNQEPD